jgi:hypothetical protein
LAKTADELETLISEMDKQTARIHIAAHLVTHSAKDCSLMISAPDGDFARAEYFVIDFDLKQPELLICNSLKLDQDVLEAYLSARDIFLMTGCHC